MTFLSSRISFSALEVHNHPLRSHVFQKVSSNINLLNLILHYHHREYIIIMSTLPFPKFVPPQFSTNIWLENVELIIFDDSMYCTYDIIIGRNIIQQFGFIINFAKNETSCLNVTLPFLQRNTQPSTEPIIV